MKQQQEQMQRDVARQNILEAQREPLGRIQFASDILAGQPSIQQSISQQQIPYTNPLAAAVGGGLAGLGGLGALYSPQ